VLDMISIPDINTGGHIAHIGGALFGFLFIKQLQLGNDWSKPFYSVVDSVAGIFNFSKKPRVVHRAKKRKNKEKDSNTFSGDKQEKIDHILDKIARSGYETLSKEEKEFLFRVSKED